MRLNEIKEEVFDVIVATPRGGSHKEGKALPYDQARQLLIRTFEEYKVPMFREEPKNVEWDWINEDQVKLRNTRTGVVIFFWLRNASNKR